jgi:hypothetical protein
MADWVQRVGIEIYLPTTSQQTYKSQWHPHTSANYGFPLTCYICVESSFGGYEMKLKSVPLLLLLPVLMVVDGACWSGYWTIAYLHTVAHLCQLHPTPTPYLTYTPYHTFTPVPTVMPTPTPTSTLVPTSTLPATVIAES